MQHAQDGDMPSRYAQTLARDRVVWKALRDLVEAQKPRDSDKIALYRLVTESFDIINDEGSPKTEELARRAALLWHVEGLPDHAIACILGIPAKRIAGMVRLGRAAMVLQGLCGVLIIEDEPMLAMELIQIITDFGANVVGVARTRAEAVSLMQRLSPDLLVADLKLADDSSGLDAVHDILAIEPDVPVIVITGHHVILDTDLRDAPICILEKPLEAEALSTLIGNQFSRAV